MVSKAEYFLHHRADVTEAALAPKYHTSRSTRVLGSDARLDRERVRELDRSMVLVEVAVEESETL